VLAFAGVIKLAVPSTTPRIARAAKANFFMTLSVGLRGSRDWLRCVGSAVPRHQLADRGKVTGRRRAGAEVFHSAVRCGSRRHRLARCRDHSESSP
jgi:hypothetical protein